MKLTIASFSFSPHLLCFLQRIAPILTSTRDDHGNGKSNEWACANDEVDFAGRLEQFYQLVHMQKIEEQIVCTFYTF